jgi:hypothetical protein
LEWATRTLQLNRKQRKSRLFNRFGKEEALTGIRSMLNDPSLCYEMIAQHFGVTRQRIVQIAAGMGVDGPRRQHQRRLLTPIL